ncbi:MAG: hypothetical protein ACLQUW_08505 [Desulfobaccales bacterium]
MENNSFDYPQKGEHLFKEIVGDWHNACLYPLKSDMWLNYLIGYKDAADILVEYVNKTNNKPDLIVFPIVFLYRHYLELQLKMVIKDGYQLLFMNKDYAKCHKLDELWNDCKIIIEKIWPGGDKEPVEAMDDYINQFCQVDPTSTEFRYPVRRNGADTLENLDYINLSHLSKIMKSIENFIGGIHEAISIELETIRDHVESPNDWY